MEKTAAISSAQNERRQGATASAAIAVERNRYYTGRYLAARDFCDEQDYFINRRHLLNRVLHGWGIVCGLEVHHHPDWDAHQNGGPNTQCARRWVVISAGMALDCRGREIIMQRDLYYELEHLNPAWNTPAPANPERGPGEQRPDTRRRFLLGIAYREELAEFTPVLYSEEACDPRQTAANRVREGWHIVEQRYKKSLRGTCWIDEGQNERPTYFDDCYSPLEVGAQGNCLQAPCTCPHDMVPLALVEYDPAHPDEGFTIDMLGRRNVRPTPEALTHIVAINWPHGGKLRLSELRAREGRLRVTFDRNLYEPPPPEASGHEPPYDPIGVNRWTFTVQYHRAQDGAYTPQTLFNDDIAPHVENGREAVFTINPDWLRGSADLSDAVLFITLRCDFILDCHGRPVDGNHLRGRVRSGDGAPGGTFESWVHIEDDEPWRRQRGRERSERERAEAERAEAERRSAAGGSRQGPAEPQNRFDEMEDE